MSTIVVLGAGPIGTATACRLASQEAARHVVLVDGALAAAQGLALDIAQAGAVSGHSTRLGSAADLGAVIGATAIVLADRFGGSEWQGEEGLTYAAAARALNPRALLVCAGVQQAAIVERLVDERQADRRLLVGTATEALRLGVTSIVALAADVAAADVTLTVAGRPPRDWFVAWHGASIGGSAATDVLSAPVVARLDAQAARLWPPGPLALGLAAARAVTRSLGNVAGLQSLLLVPPDDGGVRRACLCVPASLGSAGVTPRWPALAPRDRVRLEALAAT